MENKLRVVFATNNENKMKEIRHILQDLDVDVLSMSEVGIDMDIVEDGNTYEENSRIKVFALRDELRRRKDITPTIIVADDSGIEIDALDGEPGIFSARFLGKEATYLERNKFILDKLGNLPDDLRECHYTCCMTLLYPYSNAIVQKKRYWYGTITKEMRGTGGFAYDCIMVPNVLNPEKLTIAEMGDEYKNSISHRAKALNSIRKVIEKYLEQQKRIEKHMEKCKEEIQS